MNCFHADKNPLEHKILKNTVQIEYGTINHELPISNKILLPAQDCEIGFIKVRLL